MYRHNSNFIYKDGQSLVEVGQQVGCDTDDLSPKEYEGSVSPHKVGSPQRAALCKYQGSRERQAAVNERERCGADSAATIRNLPTSHGQSVVGVCKY